MLSCSPPTPLRVRVLKEKSCGSCGACGVGSLSTRRKSFETFFGDHLLFLYSLHANLISQYFLGSSLFSLCAFVGWSDFSTKMGQKMYKRRFHTAGIR